MRFWQEHGFQYPAVFSIFAPKLITSAQKTDSVISRLTEKCHRIVIVSGIRLRQGAAIS